MANYWRQHGFCVYFRISLLVSQSPSIVWQVSLVTGDWWILILCIYSPAPFTQSFNRLGRRMISLQRSRNRTRVTQPELTLFRAPYPLDQRSFPLTLKTVSMSVNRPLAQLSQSAIFIIGRQLLFFWSKSEHGTKIPFVQCRKRKRLNTKAKNWKCTGGRKKENFGLFLLLMQTKVVQFVFLTDKFGREKNRNCQLSRGKPLEVQSKYIGPSLWAFETDISQVTIAWERKVLVRRKPLSCDSYSRCL